MQDTFLGPPSDLDEIVEGIREVQAHAPAFVRARYRRRGRPGIADVWTIAHNGLYWLPEKTGRGPGDNLRDYWRDSSRCSRQAGWIADCSVS